MTNVEIFMCVVVGFVGFSAIAFMAYMTHLLSVISTDLVCIRLSVGRIEDRTSDCEVTLDAINDVLHDEGEEECAVSDDTEDKDVEEVTEYIVEIEDMDDEEDEIDIHLITPEQYYFGNGYSKNELKYRPNTDQVMGEIGVDTYLVMEDIPEYIGDALVFFGMNVKEPDVVYVRNHILNADFRIEKVG